VIVRHSFIDVLVIVRHSFIDVLVIVRHSFIDVLVIVRHSFIYMLGMVWYVTATVTIQSPHVSPYDWMVPTVPR
jgi:hypothetical protein